MITLNLNQRIALKYYKAYGMLCSSVHEHIESEDGCRMRVLREQLFAQYKRYDPDNSFDVSKDYD